MTRSSRAVLIIRAEALICSKAARRAGLDRWRSRVRRRFFRGRLILKLIGRCCDFVSIQVIFQSTMRG
jgi:hypothetical protein